MFESTAVRSVGPAALALVLAGCGGEGSPSGDGRGSREGDGPSAEPVGPPATERVTITVDGAARSYRLIVPRAASDARLPLIVALHGGGSERDGTVMEGRWERLRGEPLALAFPEALGGHWRIGRPEPAPPAPQPEVAPAPESAGPSSAGPSPGSPPPLPPAPRVEPTPSDVGYLTAVVEAVIAAHPVDPEQVYVVGFAEGGALAWEVFCADAGRYAGFGVVSQGMTEHVARSCAPPRGRPLAYFHGTADYLFNGGILDKTPDQGEIRFLSAEDTVSRVAEVMACGDGKRSDETLPDRTDDGTRVSTSDWPGCTAGGKLRVYRIEGGGRAWPGERSAAIAPRFRATTDIDAIDELLTYFGLGEG